MTTTGIKLDPQTLERLKNLAGAKDRSVHWLMKEAIGRYLIDEERFEREKSEDESRYQRYLDTGSHLSTEAMDTWFEQLAEESQRESASG
jgi:predicted transcriptional regulator